MGQGQVTYRKQIAFIERRRDPCPASTLDSPYFAATLSDDQRGSGRASRAVDTEVHTQIDCQRGWAERYIEGSGFVTLRPE
jgi:hypothetical protein